MNAPRSISSEPASGCRLEPVARWEDSSTRSWVSPLERSRVRYVRWYSSTSSLRRLESSTDAASARRDTAMDLIFPEPRLPVVVLELQLRADGGYSRARSAADVEAPVHPQPLRAVRRDHLEPERKQSVCARGA